MRRTIARVVTIEQACHQEKVDAAKLLEELRRSIPSDSGVSRQLVSIKRIDPAEQIN
jgi:hypothetical protein